MKSHAKASLSRGFVTLMAGLLLGACNVEPSQEEPVTTDAQAKMTLSPDPYADAVGPGSSALILNPALAVGAPDGRAATVVSLLNAALVLDLGAGEEGAGDLKVYYQGLTVALVAQVDFLAANGSVIASGPLRLVEVSAGTHVAVVPYTGGSFPYRYVRLWGGLVALYGVDAIETLPGRVCGDGHVVGAETCDDGNVLSGDGCSSVCQVESGYTCQGQPSVCTDIDECALGTDTCAENEVCVNTPGSYTCEPASCDPPRMTCGGACVDPRTDNNHCGACGNACGPNRNCSAGVCVGTGTLQFTATWGRAGDMDIIVKTPTGKLITFLNTGPSADTDFGQLDVDNTQGTGPENIFWATSTTPPSGHYTVCLMATNFGPKPSPSEPVSYTVRVRQTGRPDTVFTGERTAEVHEFECVETSANFVGAVDFP